MPLTRARDGYGVRDDEIRFVMRDGQFEIICQIGLETLSRSGNAIDFGETIETFQRDRTRIERAASNKYDRTTRQDYEIITLTAADLAVNFDS
jgi:uncharacterized protein DUF1488